MDAILLPLVGKSKTILGPSRLTLCPGNQMSFCVSQTTLSTPKKVNKRKKFKFLFLLLFSVCLIKGN